MVQVGLIWRVARAAHDEEDQEGAQEEDGLVPEPHPRLQLEAAAWYEVTHSKATRQRRKLLLVISGCSSQLLMIAQVFFSEFTLLCFTCPK